MCHLAVYLVAVSHSDQRLRLPRNRSAFPAGPVENSRFVLGVTGTAVDQARSELLVAVGTEEPEDSGDTGADLHHMRAGSWTEVVPGCLDSSLAAAE